MSSLLTVAVPVALMATPFAPVASIVPALPVTMTSVAEIAFLSALMMEPPSELATVAVSVARIAMPPASSA